MNIALFHHSLPEPDRKPGGVEVFVHRLGEALVDRGHRVTSHAYAASSLPQAYEVRLLHPSLAARSRVVRQYIAPWLFNVRPFGDRFDVAHLHGDDWFYVRRTLPTVRTFHGAAIFEAATATSLKRKVNSTLIFGLELLAARQADATYAVGSESRALFGAEGVLVCGLPPVSSVPVERSTYPVVLFVGTWEGRKRGRFLRDVFRDAVRPVLPDAELWMVSDRAEEEPGVRWFQHPSDEALWRLYRQAWTFCLPSRYEGLGLPYIEALAHGTPIVATPNPGAVEVLRGGMYGDIVDDEDLGAALVRSLTDDTLRGRLATAGVQRAADYAWPKLIVQYEAAYDLAISRYRAARRRSGR
jgi:glycosyltransferase involved in cell wall biosynthesis